MVTGIDLGLGALKGESGRVKSAHRQIARDVVTQLLGRLIAPFRFLTQGPHHYAIKGAGEIASQAFSGAFRPIQMFERRCLSSQEANLGKKIFRTVMIKLGGAGASSQITRAISCGARLLSR